MNLITVARKPEETCEQGLLAIRTRNTGVNPYSFTISVLGSFTCTTNPSTWDLWLYNPSEGQSNCGEQILLKDTSVTPGLDQGLKPTLC